MFIPRLLCNINVASNMHPHNSHDAYALYNNSAKKEDLATL